MEGTGGDLAGGQWSLQSEQGTAPCLDAGTVTQLAGTRATGDGMHPGMAPPADWQQVRSHPRPPLQAQRQRLNPLNFERVEPPHPQAQRGGSRPAGSPRIIPRRPSRALSSRLSLV